jgi:hypothetical protein
VANAALRRCERNTIDTYSHNLNCARRRLYSTNLIIATQRVPNSAGVKVSSNCDENIVSCRRWRKSFAVAESSEILNYRFNLSSDTDLIQNIIVCGFIESPEYINRF